MRHTDTLRGAWASPERAAWAGWEPDQVAAAASLVPELTELLSADTSFPSLLATVCERSARAFGGRRASIYLLEEGVLVPRMSRRVDKVRDAASWATFRSKGLVPPIVEAAVARGRPLVAPRVGSRPDGAWWAEKFGVRSAMAVPLGGQGRVVGGLVIDSPVHDAFDDETVRRLAGAAGPLGAIVEWGLRVDCQATELGAARAVRQMLEEGSAAMTAMEAALSVGRVVSRVLETERAVVLYFRDPEARSLEVATIDLPPDLDLAVRKAVAGISLANSPGWRIVTAARDPYFVHRAEEQPTRPNGIVRTLGLRSYASIPLLAGGALVGRVLCGEVSRTRRWRAADRAMVTQLALESALVMEGARLREAEVAHRAQLAHQASHDPLTGLPNRRALAERLAESLEQARAQGRPQTVLLVDLDRFKEVNDTLGHHNGDALLALVARRLETALDRGGLLGRLGGDEFAAVLEPGLGWEEGELVAARFVGALEEPFCLDGSGIRVGASIGVASYPDHVEDGSMLMQRADSAMYGAKESRLPWLVYLPGSERCAPRRTELAGGLAQAMANDELVLHYQPKVALDGGAVVGAEALVRWRHPRLGLLAPREFLPMVKATGQLGALTSWVLDHALAQCAAWRAAGTSLPVSVNISALDLADAGFPERVGDALRRHGLPGSALLLELTEHIQLVQPGLAVDVVSAVRRLGVRVSLDDFGTGFASLAYLESLPVDELKIDRSFLVAGMTPERAAVVRAILALGRDLGLDVVAEGFESAEVADRLADLGCGTAQGYHFATPLEAPALEAWLAARPAPAEAVSSGPSRRRPAPARQARLASSA